MQSRKMSLIEKLVDSASGFAISWALTIVAMPALFGIQTSARSSFWITAFYTGVSIVRGYIWRRFFNRLCQTTGNGK